MAFVANGAQGMNVVFEDRDKNTASVQFFVPEAVVIETAETFITTTLPTTLGALSDAFIRRVTLSRTYENDAYVMPVEASDVERKGSFSWRATDRSRSKTEIPSLKNTLVVDGSNPAIINMADPAVTAFVAMMVDAGLLDTYGLGNYRGVKLSELIGAGRKIHRGSSKG